MDINWTVVGLILDVIGFILVFAFGGFSVGRVSIVAQDSKEFKLLKIFGAFLVIAGFALQIVGALN